MPLAIACSKLTMGIEVSAAFSDISGDLVLWQTCHHDQKRLRTLMEINNQLDTTDKSFYKNIRPQSLNHFKLPLKDMPYPKTNKPLLYNSSESKKNSRYISYGYV